MDSGFCILCGKLYLRENKQTFICKNCYIALNPIKGRICEKCGIPLISESSKCMNCRDKNLFYKQNKSIFIYNRGIKELIYQYKFNNYKLLGYFFALELYKSILKFPENMVIIPVPGRRSVKKYRGWEHIDLICKILKHKYNLPVKNILLRRGNKSQKTLDRSMRLKNLKENIYINPGYDWFPDNVLLIDDIFTTGTTINECSKILLNQGIYNIYSLTIAID